MEGLADTFMLTHYTCQPVCHFHRQLSLHPCDCIANSDGWGGEDDIRTFCKYPFPAELPHPVLGVDRCKHRFHVHPGAQVCSTPVAHSQVESCWTLSTGCQLCITLNTVVFRVDVRQVIVNEKQGVARTCLQTGGYERAGVHEFFWTFFFLEEWGRQLE